MDRLPISVIVVAKNAERTIDDCLSSVQRSNPVEIIVVDGNSTDRTAEIARRYTNGVYSDGGRGLGYARQLGAEQATQEYIAYVDSDVIVTEEALAKMFSALMSSDYTCVCAQAPPTTTNYPSYWQRRRLEHDLLARRPGVSTACGIWRRETILKYRFDPFMKGGEDPDLQLRLSKEKPKYGIAQAFVYHELQSGLKYFTMVEGRDLARLAWKHGLFKLRFCPPLLTLYKLAICLMRGKPKLIPYIVVQGVFMSVGMSKGFIEIIRSPEDRPRPSFRFSI